MEAICNLTWEIVRDRSARKLGGIDIYCFDCDLNFRHSGIPCMKHTLPEEMPARDARVREQMREWANARISKSRRQR